MSKKIPCRCATYPWPHKLGGGRCLNTSIHPPFCAACGRHTTVVLSDDSVEGPANWLPLSKCCSAPLLEDQIKKDPYFNDDL